MKQLVETVRVSADDWHQEFELETHHGLEFGGFHVETDSTADSADTPGVWGSADG